MNRYGWRRRILSHFEWVSLHTKAIQPNIYCLIFKYKWSRIYVSKTTFSKFSSSTSLECRFLLTRYHDGKAQLHKIKSNKSAGFYNARLQYSCIFQVKKILLFNFFSTDWFDEQIDLIKLPLPLDTMRWGGIIIKRMIELERLSNCTSRCSRFTSYHNIINTFPKHFFSLLIFR